MSHLSWQAWHHIVRVELSMPKILHMFKGRKRRKGRLRRALGLSKKAADANIIVQFPPRTAEIEDEYPEYEIISRWLKLADEMLGNTDHPQYDSGSDRKQA
jgi:hypothetical protein